MLMPNRAHSPAHWPFRSLSKAQAEQCVCCKQAMLELALIATTARSCVLTCGGSTVLPADCARCLRSLHLQMDQGHL